VVVIADEEEGGGQRSVEREKSGVRRSRHSVLNVRGRERCMNVKKHSLTKFTPSGLFITYDAFT
jgi:hypothetical protein